MHLCVRFNTKTPVWILVCMYVYLCIHTCMYVPFDWMGLALHLPAGVSLSACWNILYSCFVHFEWESRGKLHAWLWCAYTCVYVRGVCDTNVCLRWEFIWDDIDEWRWMPTCICACTHVVTSLILLCVGEHSLVMLCVYMWVWYCCVLVSTLLCDVCEHVFVCVMRLTYDIHACRLACVHTAIYIYIYIYIYIALLL